ncbi:MAG: hypothetical protein ACRDSL_14655 [Pseudonocardiaceae bacterium]
MASAPGTRLRDGRWPAGTLVLTPHGVRARVLNHDLRSDAVFVQPTGRPERPWQLWSSSELTAFPDGVE